MKLFGNSLLYVSVALLSTVTFVGCGGGADGPELGKVSGTVTLDGKAVGEGYVVEFIPHTEKRELDNSRRSSRGMTDGSGHYSLKFGSSDSAGAVLGTHSVRIENAPEKGLPEAYSSGDGAVARGFWVTVESGSQVVDIPLDSSPTAGQVDLEKK